MKNDIKFTKTRNVKSPSRDESRNDAGTDLYIPYYSKGFIEDLMKLNEGNGISCQLILEPTDSDDPENDEMVENCEITLLPGEEIIIPSGLKVAILDKDTYLEVANKSGIATKCHVVYGAHVIDASYQGEILINLHNVGKKPAKFICGNKVVQVIHKEYIRTLWTEISNEEYGMIEKSKRGEGCMSSTGLK